MLALIAGTGELPLVLVSRLREQGVTPLICELGGFASGVDADLPRLSFRIETLGTFLADLAAHGVTQVCMAGAVRRPALNPALIDAATMPLVPRMMAAIPKGDDGALRELIAILEDHSFAVVGASEIVPDLLLSEGVPTRAKPASGHSRDASVGEAAIAEMGRNDTGQACVVLAAAVIAREDVAGTDAMLVRLVGSATGAVLFKAPKPGQDRRVDLPVIGPETARNAARAGLAGIIIAAGGVMVLDQPATIAALDDAGLFLWVRSP